MKKIQNEKNDKIMRRVYSRPLLTTIDLAAEQVLCTSGGTNYDRCQCEPSTNFYTWCNDHWKPDDDPFHRINQ